MRMVKITFIKTVHSVHLRHTSSRRCLFCRKNNTGASWHGSGKSSSFSVDALHSQQCTHYVLHLVIYTKKSSLSDKETQWQRTDADNL